MKSEDLLGLLIPVTYLVMLVIEQWKPARSFPSIRWWQGIGAIFVVVVLAINAILPSLLPVEWIAGHSLIHGSTLPLGIQLVLGFGLVTLVNYLFHVIQHRFTFLWRWQHQLHHSPQRVDISGSAYTHPFEVITFTLMFLAITVFILGLSSLAAAWLGYVGAFLAMFQHWNIRTPRWLGYFVQRPEAHCWHHEPGQARYNFGDLPLWDLVFGTFYNPEAFSGPVGFDEPAAKRVKDMLLGRQVSF